jgi:hypothetical protein
VFCCSSPQIRNVYERSFSRFAAGRCAKALRAKKALQALPSSACFCLKQLSTFAASGMTPRHSLKASGAHAALCQGAPRFSSPEAVAAQTSSATTKNRRLKRSIISVHSSGTLLLNFFGLEELGKKPISSTARSKRLNAGA